MSSKVAYVTGGMGGIGTVICQRLAKDGFTVIAGCGPNRDFQKWLGEQAELGYTFHASVGNVADWDSTVETFKKVFADFGRVDVLVNNAGIANMGPLALQSLDQFKPHFDVNVFGLLRASQAFAPLLGMDETLAGKPGRIINITSVGGKLASPFLGAYTATKHAVESITDSLRRELVIFGIDAIAVGPGAVRTPIWDKAEQDNSGNPYSNSPWAKPIEKFTETMLEGGRTGLDPQVIAETIETALTTTKPKARYAPVPDKLTNFTLPMLLPKRFIDGFFWKRFGMVPK